MCIVPHCFALMPRRERSSSNSLAECWPDWCSRSSRVYWWRHPGLHRVTRLGWPFRSPSTGGASCIHCRGKQRARVAGDEVLVSLCLINGAPEWFIPAVYVEYGPRRVRCDYLLKCNNDVLEHLGVTAWSVNHSQLHGHRAHLRYLISGQCAFESVSAKTNQD